jgi:hypothetical protein
MNCPRCGTQVKPDDKFCASCGATLAREQKPKRSRRERLAALVGTTQRERRITAVTAVAIAVAIVALIVIFVTTEDVEEGEIPKDEYTQAADKICEDSKLRVGAALQQASSPAQLAQDLVVIVAEWRSAFNDLEVPEDPSERVVLAVGLDEALREVESEAGAMAREGRAGNRGAMLERAQAVDSSTKRVEDAIDALALERCGQVGFVVSSG